jgi:ATP-binding cassette subfamily C (CFTR/MRP) protein 1
MHKQLIALSLVVIQLGNVLTLRLSSPPFQLIDLRILPAVTSFLAYLGLCPLFTVENSRSVQPSTLAVLYLLASVAYHTADFGSNVYNGPPLVLWLTTSRLCLEVLLLVSECQGKERILRDPYRGLPPEQTAGILSRILFWWINPILVQGSSKILTGDDLPYIDQELCSKTLRKKALRTWDQRGK